MVRFTAAVLVGCLLAVPPTLALDSQVSSPLLTQQDLDLGAIAVPDEFLDAPGDRASPEVPIPDTSVLTSALTCRNAVAITLTGWGGRVTATQTQQGEIVMPWTVYQRTSSHSPIYRTINERVTGLAGLLPIAQPVTQLIGFETVTTTTSKTYDLAVDVQWTGRLIEWTRVTDSLLVSAAVGWPFLATGDGALTQVCDPSVEILPAIPDRRHPEYQYWSLHERTSYWRWTVDTLDVHLATEQEKAERERTHYWSLCPSQVWNAIRSNVEDLGLGNSTILPDDGSDGTVFTPAGAETASVAGASTTAGILWTSLAVGAGLAAALGAAMIVLRRRN